MGDAALEKLRTDLPTLTTSQIETLASWFADNAFMRDAHDICDADLARQKET